MAESYIVVVMDQTGYGRQKVLKKYVYLRTADNRLEATIARGRRFKEVKKKILYVVISIIK